MEIPLAWREREEWRKTELGTLDDAMNCNLSFTYVGKEKCISDN